MKNEQFDEEIQDYLSLYKVDLPDEDEMERSIAAIMSSVPKKKSSLLVWQNGARSLLQNSIRELMHFGALFWVINVLFLILGAITLIDRSADPYLTAFILAPLPFITGTYEIFKSRDEGLVELEMSLKYNTHQVFLSRLVAVGVMNFVLNAALCTLFASFYPQMLVVKLLLCWTIPYVFVTGIAFLFAMNVRSSIASGTLAAVWFAFCFGFLQGEEFQRMVMQMDIVTAIAILLIGVMLWAIGVQRMKKITIGRENYEA
ncbi:hypothetical protein ACFFJY_01405 [Fictibacillus aquaticus]|uniref:Uncharacterized protein n=1 Tax=Fictibacillus aquaticus TaxID=2021314 RepID=A0A235F807_9BACL|nr:hypothetical protein [Fictibacillus aquaticus]OYD57372.1 hypothetical protein CGZ90_11875 [Fictibacillus aquaticus]